MEMIKRFRPRLFQKLVPHISANHNPFVTKASAAARDRTESELIAFVSCLLHEADGEGELCRSISRFKLGSAGISSWLYLR
jgi:hypothetical protein